MLILPKNVNEGFHLLNLPQFIIKKSGQIMMLSALWTSFQRFHRSQPNNFLQNEAWYILTILSWKHSRRWAGIVLDVYFGKLAAVANCWQAGNYGLGWSYDLWFQIYICVCPEWDGLTCCCLSWLPAWMGRLASPWRGDCPANTGSKALPGLTATVRQRVECSGLVLCCGEKMR